jgi:hyaluronate lyase
MVKMMKKWKWLIGFWALALLALLMQVPLTHAADEYDTLRQKWADMLTGGASINTADTDIQAAVERVTAKAQSDSGTLDRGTSRTYLWSDLPITNSSGSIVSANITASYTRLYEMALAYATTSSTLYHDASLKSDISSGLDWLYTNYYHSGASKTSNWWDWEIGTPLQLNNTVVLMYADLTSTQITNYMTAVNYFQPTVTQTGANRMWECTVIGVRGVIVKDSTKIAAARDGLSPLFNYVTTSDGFYADGSFIQHVYFPYTGSYGVSLLEDMSRMLYLLHGSTWDVTDPGVAKVYQWVYNSFQPVIYKGGIMDSTVGRALSRSYSQEHTVGHQAMRSILLLSQVAPAADAATMNSMLKEWIQHDTYLSFYADATVTAAAQAKALMGNTSVTARGELLLYKQFAGMDRSVWLRSGYGFGISMFSTRIKNAEMANSENAHGWHTADGMTYLYNGDLGQFSGNYWPTVDAHRLPGTTVEHNTQPSGNRLSDKSWVGGAELLGTYGVTGMNLHTPGQTLTGKKSWFMFDDEAVALGAGIADTDGVMPETIVENRKLNDSGNNALSVGGTAKSTSDGWSETMSGVSWINLAGNAAGQDIGYYFPGGATVNGLRELRSGKWTDIDTRSTNKETATYTNHFLTMWINHDTNQQYAYVLLPNKTAAQTSAYAGNPDIEVVENSVQAQAVREKNLQILGVNFWEDASKTVDYITSNKKAAVISKKNADGSIDISVSDPTQLNTGSIQIGLNLSAGSYTADPGITVTQLSPTIQFTVGTGGSLGKSFHAHFNPGNAVNPTWNLIFDPMDSYTSGWGTSGTTGSVTQNSGTVTVKDTASGTTGSYFYLTKNAFTAPAGAFTFETRAKVDATGTTNELTVRGSSYQVSVYLTATQAQNAETSPTKTFALDATVYHTYRIVAHSDHTYDLYVDGNLAWSGAASSGSGTDILKLGGTNASLANLELDYVRLESRESLP